MQKAGVKVGKGGIWVGAESEKSAADKLRHTLVPCVIEAFGRLEELRELAADGIPSQAEYKAYLEVQQKDELW